jgi:hypothetical protein
MAASDAKPIPRKNVAHRVYFPIYDADGDLITDATGLLGLTSVDAAPLVTTTSAPVQVSTSSGIYFCDLTAGEMNGDGVIAKFTSSSAGAKAAVIVMYPQENEDIKVSITHWGSSPVLSVGVAGVPKVDVTHWISTAAATPTVAGVPEVDVTHYAGSTTDVSTIPASIAAILVDTGTTLQAELDGIQADTEDIQARLPAALTAGGNMKSDSLAVSGSTESADRLERSTLAIVTGTIGASSTTTALIFSSVSPSSIVNDQFVGRIITFDKDTTTTALRGQATDITDWVHATLTATVTALTTAPVSGDTCTIT